MAQTSHVEHTCLTRSKVMVSPRSLKHDTLSKDPNVPSDAPSRQFSSRPSHHPTGFVQNCLLKEHHPSRSGQGASEILRTFSIRLHRTAEQICALILRSRNELNLKTWLISQQPSPSTNNPYVLVINITRFRLVDKGMTVSLNNQGNGPPVGLSALACPDHGIQFTRYEDAPLGETRLPISTSRSSFPRQANNMYPDTPLAQSVSILKVNESESTPGKTNQCKFSRACRNASLIFAFSLSTNPKALKPFFSVLDQRVVGPKFSPCSIPPCGYKREPQ